MQTTAEQAPQATTKVESVEVSVSVKATVEITEQVKNKIKEKFPYAFSQCNDDAESLAIVILFAALDGIMPISLEWNGSSITGITVD